MEGWGFEREEVSGRGDSLRGGLEHLSRMDDCFWGPTYDGVQLTHTTLRCCSCCSCSCSCSGSFSFLLFLLLLLLLLFFRDEYHFSDEKQ